jgi:hypothetical protein
VAGRQHLYDSIQLHRQSGQVIPTTLCEALDENALRLRDALVRYVETATPGGDHVPDEHRIAVRDFTR